MQNSLLPLLLIFVHSSAFAKEPPALPTRDSSWKLVWSDEFNKNGPPNPKTWEFEEGFVRNKELQWYRAKNTVCHNGNLIIEARREKLKNPNFQSGHPSWNKSREFAEYTSASLITKEDLAWTYGRFEILGRFPALPGLWPAIWTTGEGNWPHAGEIDIMEFYSDKILANSVHAGRGGKALWNTSTHPMKNFDRNTWDHSFHLWVMEWNEKEIAIYLDGRLLNRIDITKTINQDGPAINPFHAPQRLRLNLAIGSNAGDPSKTTFPQRYEVDYVRIYQKQSK